MCPYPTFSCTVCDGKKGRQCTLQASSWSQQVWQPSYTVRQKQYHALCQVCVCVHRCCLEETKKKSVADMLATAKCAALTRSRLVRQVSSVLPLTAGKMGMAPWANLRGSFTTRDNGHVACLHHSHPSFPRHSKKPWHPPTHMKNNDQAKSTHYLAVLRVKRGEKREDWTASSTQLAFSNNVTPHETATEKQQ